MDLMCFFLFITLVLSERSAYAQGTTSIAVVTSDKSQTRLKLLRDSPRSLVERLNSEHKGGKSEDIARAPVTSHHWVALDFDFRRKEYYVLDRLTSNLLVIFDDPQVTNRSQVLFEGVSSKVTAIAYDWLRRILYWTDPSYQAILSISISYLCGDRSCASFPPQTRTRRKHITSVIGNGLTEPCAIAVDPVRGYLYWADDGPSPSIEMSSLIGRNRTVLTRGLIGPAGLTLDYQNNVLYWIERLSGLSVINMCLLNGSRCFPVRVSTVYQSRLYDLDFHKGFLISSDLAENRLVVYDYTTGHTLRQNWFGTTYGICVSSLDRQPWTDIPDSETLATSPTLAFQNITEHGVILLASVQTGIFAVEKTFSMGHAPPPLFSLVKETGITTMAIDMRRRRLFYYSQEKQSIFRLTLPHKISESNKGTRTEIMTSWIQSVTGLAVDWSNGNVYWLDAGYQRIMVSRDDGRFVKVVHHENITNPQDLVIDSNSRYMFWSDVFDNAPWIERSDLDGYNRLTLLHKNAFYDRPRALAIDFRKSRLYWSDGPYLCQATLNGNVLRDFRRTDYTSTAGINAIHVMHDYILWTDLIGGIKSADVDLDFPLSHVNVPAHFSDTVFSDVIYFHESRQTELSNPCVVKYLTTTTPPSNSANHTHTFNNNSDNAYPSGIFENAGYVMAEDPVCSQLCLTSCNGPLCACATGYWLKSNGSCVPGTTVNDFLIFCDTKTGRLFRQFVLLPDYYALPLADHTHVKDVAVDAIENKIYWIDSGRNMIHAADVTDTHHSVVLAAGHSFNLTKIVLEPSYRLLYVVTSCGDVILMSLITHFLVFIVKDSEWTVHDLAVDVDNRQLYLTVTSKPNQTNISNVAMTTTGAILCADLDGANLRTFLTTKGRPESVTVYKGNIIWTDAGLQGVYSTARNGSPSCGLANDGSVDGDCQVVLTLAHLGSGSSPGDVLVYDDVIYFTDQSKRAVQRLSLKEPAGVSSLGFPFMNEITGLNYFTSRTTRRHSSRIYCNGIFVLKPEGPECLCGEDRIAETGHGFECQCALELLEKEAKVHGLCLIISPENGSVQGGYDGDYVLSEQQITVTCDPGYILSNTWNRSETRKCSKGAWTSLLTCKSVLNYTVHGNLERGYVIFNESAMFVVPRGITEVDVVCIGGGGGGYDGCDKQLRKNRARAGMGEVSKFGNYLRAYGGQGGTLHEGGRGGRGRSIFGGDGQLSSSCLGGGAAGETRSATYCHLSHTSCLFCGAGGAMPSCSVCPFRPGGCSGLGSETGTEPGAADNYGGGATGTFGGGSGGGGGVSRKIVRVSPWEEVAVKVGRGGVPSAKPAGNGVVVVGWGASLENMIDRPDKKLGCKPFTYKLDDESAINFPDRCF